MFLKTLCARSEQKILTKLLLITKITSILILGTCLQANAKLNSRTLQPPIEIHGRVINQAGNPLQGASVLIAGTQNGTTTNSDGRFTMTVPDPNTTLDISSVGFQTKRVNVGNQTDITIVLESAITGLTDVVVVGYGTTRKRDLTGSISSVPSEKLNAFPTANVMQALSGRAAGVQVKQNNGQPGGAISVRIRGTNSIVGNNEPLYVVDGFPVSSPNNINNSSIESIEVLKDASAVAIYGSRAANGVVLITTKRGKIGTSKVSLQSSFGIQRLIKKMKMMNPEEYGLYYNQLYANMGRPPLFNDAEMSNFASLGEGTDWQNVVFHDAPIQNHSANISGGNEKTQFSVTGSIFDQEGIIRNSSYKRYSFNNSIQHKISKSVSVDINLTMSKNVTFRQLSEQGRFGTSLIGRAFGIPAALPVYENDGSYMEPVKHYNWVSEALFSPLDYINEQSDKVAEDRVLVNGGVSYKIIKGLMLRISGGVESNNARNDFYQTKHFQNNPDGVARVGANSFTSLLNENILSYTNAFNKKHKISAVAGFTYQNFIATSLNAGGTGFLSDITESYSLATASTPSIPSTSYSKSVLLSGLGRINYSFNDRYLFTVSFRADGSSIYTAGNKWGYFPSAAFSWRLSDEDFLKNVEFIKDLKIRTSWGRAGSQAISPYSTINLLNPGSTVFGSSTYTTLSPSAGLAADLKWETTEELDFGLDFSVLDGNLHFTADYYNKETSNLLNSVQLARSTGYTNSLRNIGKISNKGWELSVNSQIFSTKSFKWDLDANITFNRSKVLELYAGKDILAGQLSMIRFTDWGNTYRVGEPLGVIYGYQEDGYDENGFLKYKSTDQKVKIGDPNPNFIFGINSNMTYKSFGLSLFLSGTQGNDLINMSAVAFTVDNTNGTNKLKEVLNNYWTPKNTNAKYPVPNLNQKFLFSDRYVEDGSYIRLRNIEFSYNLPLKGISGISKAEVYISAQNILTFTKYSWIDPDVNSRGGSNSLDQGIDYATYPSAKSISAGVRLEF